MECVDFAEKHILLGQFQWFIDIVSYLQFVIGGTVLTAESQRDEVHSSKVRNKKEQSIVILAFKTYVSYILGGLEEVKESTAPLTDIHTPEIWSAQDGVWGVYLQSSKSLKYKSLKLNAGINRELGRHIEARMLASEFLRKCSVF